MRAQSETSLSTVTYLVQLFLLILHRNLDLLDFSELGKVHPQLVFVDFRSKTTAEDLLDAFPSFGFFWLDLFVVQGVRFFRQNLRKKKNSQRTFQVENKKKPISSLTSRYTDMTGYRGQEENFVRLKDEKQKFLSQKRTSSR